MILDLGQRRLSVPAECQEPWMENHRSLRPANSIWQHQQVMTRTKGSLDIRQDHRVLEIVGRGGRVHLDHQHHNLQTFCDGGFWITQTLRFYDISSRVKAGELATHTSLIKKNNQLWLLAGHSGAGKTTASDIATDNGWQKIQDDLAFLKEGRYQAGIDWSEKDKKKTASGFRISGIAVLEKAIDHRLIPLDYKEALMKVGPIWGFPKVQEPQDWLPLIDRELSLIPVYRLRFRKDAGFLNLLENR